MVPSLHHTEARLSIKTRLLALQPEQQPKWGSLNTAKLMAHLIDSFAMVFSEKDNITPGGVFFATTLGQWLIIRSPVPWPKGVQVPPEFFATDPVDFAADRQRVLAYLDRFAQPPQRFQWAPSPEFGVLTWRQHGYLQYRHVQHHLKQFGV